MSKVAIAVLGGIAAVATAGVGGIVLNGKGEDRDHSWEGGESVQLNSKLDFTTLASFKNKKGGSCVSKSFGEVDFSAAGTAAYGMTKDDFKVLENGDPRKGCLIVNWERTQYTKNDQLGVDSRWLWSFRSGDSGFVMFVTTKDNALNLEGAFYILEKKGDKWSIKKKQDVASNAQVTISTPSNELPTVGTGLPKTSSGESVDWDVIKSVDANKICHSSCDKNNSNTKEKSYAWWFSSHNMPPSGADLTSWTGNLDTWYSNVFKPNNLKLSEALKNIKGVWRFAG